MAALQSMSPSCVSLSCCFFIVHGLGFGQTLEELDPVQNPQISIGGDICANAPWEMIFHDEFNGAALDNSVWNTYFPYCAIGDQCLDSRTHHPYDIEGGEYQIYQDDNVEVSDGSLKLVAKNEPANWCGYGSNYTSGMIFSKAPYDFNRGKFAIRCKVPYSSSNYLWPAFWLHGGPNQCSEIDILEIVGAPSTEYHAACHRYTFDCEDNHDTEDFNATLPDLSDGFHTYVAVWDPWYVRFYIDGAWQKTVCRLQDILGNPVSNCWSVPWAWYLQEQAFPAYHHALPIIVNLALERHWLDMTLPDFAIPELPAQFEVDWIRVWQREDQIQSGFGALGAVARTIQHNLVNQILCPEVQGTFSVSGAHGDLEWTFGPGLVIDYTDGREAQIHAATGYSGASFVRATDSDGPFGIGAVYELEIQVGAPSISAWSYMSNDAGSCGDILTIESLCQPDIPTTYSFILNGTAQSQYYSSGQWYPLDPEASSLTLYAGNDDFCFDYEVLATNQCGTATTHVLHASDGVCHIGPCDLLDPSFPDQVEDLVSVSPTPILTQFDIVIDEHVQLNIIDEIVVRDAMMLPKFQVGSPSGHSISVNSSSWPPGIYYVTVRFSGGSIALKVEVK